MRVLLIGGSGAIGRYLARYLTAQGCSVAVFGRSRHSWLDSLGCTSILGDRKQLRGSADALKSWTPDVVVDLVLSSAQQARELVEVFSNVSLVAASSMDVYQAAAVLHGDAARPTDIPLREDSELRSGRLYGPTDLERMQSAFGWLDSEYDKVAVERALFDHGNAVTILRLGMMYGPYDRQRRLREYVRQMDERHPSIALAPGLASWCSTRAYVEDVAFAFALAATNPAGQSRVYNVSEPDALSEAEWIRALAAVTGWSGSIVEDVGYGSDRPTVNYQQHLVADSSRIRHELGYSERLPRHHALMRAVAWEREQP